MLLKKFQKRSKEISLSRIITSVLIFLQILILIPLFIVSYYKFTKTIESHYEKINKQSETDLKVIISLYSNVLNYLYDIGPTKNEEKALKEFKNAFLNNYETINTQMHLLSEKYKADFMLIDREKLIIIKSTNKKRLGSNFKDWPHMERFLISLKKEEAITRSGWSQTHKEIRLFYFLPLIGGEYILEISSKIPEILNLNPVAEYISNIKKYNPYIKHIHLFDQKGFDLLEDRYQPTEKINEMLALPKKLLVEKSEFYDGIAKNKYLNFTTGENEDHFRNVTLAKIEYKYEKLIEEKREIQSLFSLIVLISLLVIYILSRMISLLITKPIMRMVEQISRTAGGKLKDLVDEDVQKDFKLLAKSVNKLARDLFDEKERTENLATNIINTQERERQSIALDLHDSIGQTLVAAKMKLALGESDPIKAIQDCKIQIEHASNEIRAICNQTYPQMLDELGLKESVIWLASEFFDSTIEYKIKIDPIEITKKTIKVHLFRIIQEAFNNIKRHSNASSFWLRMKKRNNFLHLDIEDNGTGFELSDKKDIFAGFGFQSMKLRVEDLNGSIDIIKSFDHSGLKLQIRIPLE